jgi:hypothetical protein
VIGVEQGERRLLLQHLVELRGCAAGSAWLIYRNPDSPFVLQIMPDAVYVGLGRKF